MVRQVEANGDQVIVGRNGAALVSSKSEPDSWHSVRSGVCDCKGYQYRGHCRHVRAALQATTQPIATVNPTFALYEKTLARAFDGGRARREECPVSVVQPTVTPAPAWDPDTATRRFEEIFGYTA